MRIETIRKWSVAKQWNWIRDIVKNDAEITREVYLNGKTCAIGGLAVALGAKPTSDERDLKPDPYKLVRKIPVLNEDRVSDIWYTNDTHTDRRTRIEALIELFDGWEKEDKVEKR